MPIVPRPPKTIGIVGSRRRDGVQDCVSCRVVFDQIYKYGDKVVSGGCPLGGDRFAELIAKELGLAITIYYPCKERIRQLEAEGKPRRIAFAIAAFERNTLIAEDCDVLIAVVAPDRTGGTEDTVKKARKLGKHIILVD